MINQITFDDFISRLQKTKDNNFDINYKSKIIKVTPLFYRGIDFCVFEKGTFGIGERDCEIFQFYFHKDDISEIHNYDDECFSIVFNDGSEMLLGSEVEEL